VRLAFWIGDARCLLVRPFANDHDGSPNPLGSKAVENAVCQVLTFVGAVAIRMSQLCVT